MCARARQQAAVAELGQRALARTDLAALLDEAVASVARTLETDFAAVFELSPGGRELSLRAGVGLPEHAYGHQTVGAGPDSLAGYTILSDQPVISHDLRHETRFSSPFLRACGALSGASAVIYGPERLFGVLCAYSKKRRSFTEDDAQFLRATANVLGGAVERERTEAALRLRAQVLDMVGEAAIALDPAGTIVYWNRRAESFYGWTAAEALGQPATLIVPPSYWERGEEIFARLKAGQSWTGELLVQRRDSSVFTVLASGSPIRDERGNLVGFVGVFADISARKRAEQARHVLTEASKRLANSLDFDATIGLVARLAVPALGDCCLVDIVDEDGVLRRVALAHAAPDKEARLLALRKRYPLGSAAAGVPRVVREGRAALYPEVTDAALKEFARDAEHLRLLRALGPKSAMLVPLAARGRTLGAISFVITESDRRYGAADLAVAEDIAGTAALAADNARLFRREQERRRDLEVVRDATADITGELDLARLLELIVQRATELVGSDAGVVALWDEASGRLVPRAWRGLGDWLADVRFGPGEGVHGAAAQLREGVIVNDYRTSPCADRLILEHSHLTAALAEPLLYGDRLVGTLALFRRRADRGFTAEDRPALRLFADTAAVALENARLYRELAEREQRLHDLVGRLVQAQEDERRRVAHEIHDGLAQVAAGAHRYLQSLADAHRPRAKGAAQALERALELAERTVREARALIAGLRPTALHDFGLAAAVRLEVEALRAEGWDATCEDELGADRLPAAVETALYRVAQEALTNVRKHAGPTRVWVALRRDEQGVRLEIRDWGSGFRQAAVRGGTGRREHVGLTGMVERMAVLGGRCTVRSRRGGGTHVVAEVPPAAWPVDPAGDGP